MFRPNARIRGITSSISASDVAAESFIYNLERLYGKVSDEGDDPVVQAGDIDYLVNEVAKEARTYVLDKTIDDKALRKILTALT